MQLAFVCSPRALRLHKLPALFAAIALLVLPVAASAQATRDTTFTVGSSASIEVVTRSAEITVRGGNSGRQVRVRTTGGGTVDVSGTDRSVRVDGGMSRDRDLDTIELDLPDGITLLVRTQNGDVDVRGTNGDVEVHSTSGDITVAKAARVLLDNVTGDIIASDITDGLRVSTTSGDVDVANVAGDLEVSATSAEMTVRDSESRRVQLKVVSGDINFGGLLAEGGRYDFSAHSGDVRLTVPRNSRAAIDIQTFNGEITTADLPLMLMPDPAAARREDERERARREIEQARDSVRRQVRDSMRRLDPPQSRRDSASFERNIERSVERLVESVMNAVSVQLESLSVQLDGRGSGRARRFQLGESGGPLVTISTFSGDIVIGSGSTSRPR